MDTKIPSPKEFDYYLWKDNETGKYFAKIKQTGEVCELTLKQIRFMRSEEMKIKRATTNSGKEKFEATNFNAEKDKQKVSNNEKNKSKNNNSNNDVPVILSLDALMAKSEAKSDWFEDKTDYAELVETKIIEEEFRKLLTAKQLDVYERCMLGDLSFKNYALLHKTSKQNIFLCAEGVRKKLKKFLGYID